MKELLTKLFKPVEVERITHLYEEGTVREQQLIRSTVAQTAEDSGAIFEANGTDWVLCVLCKADKPLHSTSRIFEAVAKPLVKQSWTFEGFIEIINNQCSIRNFNHLADDCLLGVSLFRKALERKTSRYGAPTPEYYSALGQFAFNTTGYEDIADDWEFWTDFLQTEFCVDKSN